MPSFSVQYCLARALLDRRVSLEHFEGDSFRDPAICTLLPRIHAAPHPEMPIASTEHFGAEVRAVLTDGQVLSAKIARLLGRGPEDPLPDDLLEAKFLNCASRALPMDISERLLTTLRALDAVADMHSVTLAMVPPTALAAD
jgi:2-methylcitrate dehydratase PrpD